MGSSFRARMHRVKTSQIVLAVSSSPGLLAQVCAVMIAETLLMLAQPWPVRAIIDRVVAVSASVQPMGEKGLWDFILASVAKSFHSGDFHFIYKWIGVLLVIYMANAVLLYRQNIALARLGQRVVLRVRKSLFSQMIALPHGFFEKAETGDLTSRISKDTADAQDILESSITILVRSIPTVIGILIVCFTLDWIYALTFLFVIPFVYWINVVFTRRTKKEVSCQRRIEGSMASNVQEALYYHKAIATLSMEQDVVEDVVECSREIALHGVQAGRFQGLLTAWLDLLVGGTSLLVLLVGVLRIMHGCLTVGQLMVFLSYLNSLFKPIREISKFTGRIAKSAAAIERIEEIARLNPAEIGAAELPDAVEASAFRGAIEFRGVCFGYDPSLPVIEGLDLKVPAGRKIAVVGESGSGKSTILQLLMRLYDPQKGKVMIDGTDIRTLTLTSLRQQMAVVLQDSFIFNATIAENIAIARPGASDGEVVEAARAAMADEFIRKLPRGYDTRAGEGGAALSGGQKRRIAIARAFLRDAPIIILDEPTTGLDAISERQVTEALRRLGTGRTTVAITHQLATASDADLIVVLSRGRIVESGNPEELLKRDGAYRRLWETQTAAGGETEPAPEVLSQG